MRCFGRPDWRQGDIVEGRLGWQQYAVSDGTGLTRVDPSLAPVSTALGVLGMPGLTAYFGLLEVARPLPGDTVLVSAASGAARIDCEMVPQIATRAPRARLSSAASAMAPPTLSK